ncbi:MAG: sulfatase-like hydrolase/transferase, partial [Planctomycetota bacterium]
FDHFHGFLGDMMDDYYTHLRGGKNFMRLNQETINPQGHASDLFSQWSIDYLRERDQSPNPKPFFLYLAYNAPHFPIQPPDRWLQRVRDREPSIPMARALNVALVEHLDDCVGRVLKCLDQLGLRDNTMVVFTSDNGGSLRHAQRNFPWRDGKQSHYDGGLRVPAIIRYPGVISKGSKSNQPAMTFDLTRTMLEIADAKIDPATDACSLQPVFAGKPMPENRAMYFVRREGNMRYVGGAYHAIIHRGLKLMRNDPFSPLELYDLESDSREENDLASKRPNDVKRLKRMLMQQIQRGGQIPWQRATPTRHEGEG